MSDNDEQKDNKQEEPKVVSLAGARESKEKVKDKEPEEKKPEQREVVVCSFCARPNYQVIKMIQGPDGVNICSECTMVCVQYFMLSDRVPSQEAQKVLDAFWSISRNN